MVDEGHKKGVLFGGVLERVGKTLLRAPGMPGGIPRGEGWFGGSAPGMPLIPRLGYALTLTRRTLSSHRSNPQSLAYVCLS